MPVDFNRVPPRVEVPPAPQPSMIVWMVLLVLVMGAGAALAVVLWLAGTPTNTLWFWFCVIGYPFMAWTFLLCSWLGYGYARRSQAIAINGVADEAEQACHVVASTPLAIFAHTWCFSSDDGENSIEGVRNGSLQAKLRPSGAVADTEVRARWLEIPGVPFYPGNELNEFSRHQVVSAWLLERLINRIGPQLAALPSRAALQVELYLTSRLKIHTVETQLRTLLAVHAPTVQVDIHSVEHTIPLFSTDAWLDKRSRDLAHLLVAITLDDAVSQLLSDSVAEAGVALLVCPLRFSSVAAPAVLRLHRPAKGTLDAAAGTVELAVRWGRSSIDRLRTAWTHGVGREIASSVRNADQFPEQMNWVVLETSVGDCSGAGPWFALALAAENAETSGDPQLVLCEEGDNLVALVCRKQT